MPKINISKKTPLQYLVTSKFPRFYREDSLHMDITTREKLEKEDCDAEAYVAELKALSEGDLQALYENEKDSQALAIEKIKKNEELRQIYNQPEAEADFDYWSKMSEWMLDEAVFLSFGKNPDIVTWKRLEGVCAHTSPFVQKCKQLKELAGRAKKANHFTDSQIALSSDPIKPYCFARWMHVNNLEFPKDLAEKVFRMHEVNKPPKTETEKLIDSMSSNIRGNSFESDTEKIGMRAKDKIHKSKPPKDDNLSERERSSYLAIIGALLGLLLGKSSSGVPHSKFASQQAIIDCIHATYGDKSGLSKRNLEDKFAKSKNKTQ